MSCPPNYYKYENDQNRVFNLIKRADKFVEPPGVECQIDSMTRLKTYSDDLGNVYKMLPVPPWRDTEESRRGGTPLGFSPKQIPPLPSQAFSIETQPHTHLH